MKPSLQLLVTACLGTACLAVPIRGNQNITFGDCSAALGAPDLLCGTLVVPMDWENQSNGETVTLGITKIPARKPSQRIGPIIYQPGGPGVLVSSTLADIVNGVTPAKAEILDRFDIIGIDLRGSGLSDPITCSRELWNTRQPFYASTPESYDALVKHNQAIRQSCIDMTGSNLIDYMDSISNAHDYEAVRQALGGEKWNWLGQSYGTLLGSYYAELYSENLRSLILDCTMSASQSETALFVMNGGSTEGAMNYFFTWCEAAGPKVCPAAFRNSSKTLPEIWDDLIEKAADFPIPAKECASGKFDCPYDNATPDDLRGGAHQLLYGEATLPYLATAIYEAAFKDDSSLFLESTPHVPKGNTYNQSEFFAENAIACQDFAHESSATMMTWWNQIAKWDMPVLRATAPGAYFVHECVGWPQPKRSPPHAISIPDTLAPKVLMVTNYHDVATPESWNLQVQQEIGEDRAVLVERKKVGHTVYFQPEAFNGSTLAAMNHYLLTLEVPAQRTIYDD